MAKESEKDIPPGTLLLTCNPFVYSGNIELSPKSSHKICDVCFQIRDEQRDVVRRCGSCHVINYCNETCQKKGWKDGHKYECKGVKEKLWNETSVLGPTSCIIFDPLPRVLMRLIVKLQDSKDHFVELDIGGSKVKRRFHDLQSNSTEFRGDSENLRLVRTAIERAKYLLGFTPKVKIPEDSELFDICCRLLTNGFHIFSNDIRVGFGLYLASSIFNHSCCKMAVHTFNGIKMEVRNVRPISKSLPIDKVTLDYIGGALVPSQMRRELLRKRFYFHCECERCVSGQFDKEMRSIICQKEGCNTEIDTEEMEKPCCSCGNTLTEELVAKVKEAEEFVQLQEGERNSVLPDLKTIESCIEKMKSANFSDTHWLMMKYYFRASEAAHDANEMEKAYAYGSKHLLGVSRYCDDYDVQRCRILENLAYYSCLVVPEQLDEGVKFITEAETIAEITHGKNSFYYKTRLDPIHSKIMAGIMIRSMKQLGIYPKQGAT